MKTVYTLTEAQYKALESAANTLQRDSSALSVDRRKSLADSLTWIVQDVADTATMQVEPRDREQWMGEERRKLAERRNGAQS